MTINAEEIFQLASTIWEATLGIPIEPAAANSSPGRARSTAACIQITGAWNGAILLDCPVGIAQRAASIMFSVAAHDLQVTDLQDAIAELVNMVGGNVKALLPETCFLSLPAVVEGGDYSTRVPGSRVLTRIGFGCEGNVASISVLEKVQPSHGAA